MTDDRLYAVHIRDCIHDIRGFVAEGRETFMTSGLVQAAVLYKLQIASESTQRLSEAAKSQHPEVNWRAIRGFRNVVVHDYLAIKLEDIWNIIERDLPALEAAVNAILLDLDKSQDPSS